MKFISYLVQTNLKLIKQAWEKKKIEAALQNVINDAKAQSVVKAGPFSGTVYPQALAYGSSFFPKIFGTYEAELQPHILALTENRYDTIIDIGCAEGYYAVGLKRMFPAANVFAADINKEARAFCRQMAEVNNCAGGFSVVGAVDPSSLEKLITGNTLIVSDCEGYEAVLFGRESKGDFSRCDLIIETHDFIDPSISTELEKRLSKTHRVISVQSLDDNLKAKYYRIPGLDNLNFGEKKFLLSEHRPQTMEWLICKKNN